jgi:regulator of sirC expression with transglutaminase-like and TPR domain
MVHEERFRELFQTRGGPVPLDEALAIICWSANSEVDPPSVLDRLDELAKQVTATTAEALMAELFGSSGFVGNSIEYDDPAYSLLNQVMSRKLGIPITLCAIAIEVGRRVGIPIIGVGMPGHFLCRSGEGSGITFFDPFHSPRPLSAQECRTLYESLTQLDNWSAEFLEPSDARIMVIRTLSNLKSIYRRRGDMANLRWVMRLRTHIPEIAAVESTEFAKLLRRSN